MRGNAKVIQEFESLYRAAGWNVIKVIWGSGWDALLEKDRSGLLRQRMMECVDGEYQNYKSQNGAYVREHFFGKYPALLELVADLSDDEIWKLSRGGHDPDKVYNAYAAAMRHSGQPTVILAKTVKGFGMGEAGEGQNINHQLKKMDLTRSRPSATASAWKSRTRNWPRKSLPQAAGRQRRGPLLRRSPAATRRPCTGPAFGLPEPADSATGELRRAVERHR